MKTLLILRHGKSDWGQPIPDHDRPLTGRGKRAAVRMGEEIRDRDLVPDLILSSTAKRARATAKRAKKACGYEGQTIKAAELYLSGVVGHLEVLSEVGPSHPRVLIVGHNPDLEDLVHELTGAAIAMPTAALACIDLELDSWAGVARAKGTLRFVLSPRELGRRVGERGGSVGA